jgi:hypothetical protein
MCSAASEWTYYQPPKSQGFGHTATPRNPLAAWGLLESFIRDHAIANEWSTNGITIDSRPEFWTPSALDAVLATFTALLGPPDVVPPGTYKARPSALYTWFQKPAAGKPILLPTVMAAIEIASHLRKTRIDGHGAFHLHFGFDFFWRGHSESQTPPVRKPFVIGEPLTGARAILTQIWALLSRTISLYNRPFSSRTRGVVPLSPTCLRRSQSSCRLN